MLPGEDMSTCNEDSELSIKTESIGKAPHLETPKHGQGKLWRGHPDAVKRIPIPGPGLPSREVRTAREALAAELEKQVAANAKSIIEAMVKAANAGNFAHAKELLDRHIGTIQQKVAVTVDSTRVAQVLLEALAPLVDVDTLARAWATAMDALEAEAGKAQAIEAEYTAGSTEPESVHETKD